MASPLPRGANPQVRRVRERRLELLHPCGHWDLNLLTPMSSRDRPCSNLRLTCEFLGEGVPVRDRSVPDLQTRALSRRCHRGAEQQAGHGRRLGTVIHGQRMAVAVDGLADAGVAETA